MLRRAGGQGASSGSPVGIPAPPSRPALVAAASQGSLLRLPFVFPLMLAWHPDAYVSPPGRRPFKEEPNSSP